MTIKYIICIVRYVIWVAVDAYICYVESLIFFFVFFWQTGISWLRDFTFIQVCFESVFSYFD